MSDPEGSIGRTNLAAWQVDDLVERVKEGLTGLLERGVVPPRRGDFAVRGRWAPDRVVEASVEIDIGFTVLTVAGMRHWGCGQLDENADLAGIARGICRQVQWALADDRYAVEIDEIARAAAAKIRRDRLPIQLMDIRLAPVPWGPSERPSHRAIWTRVNMLDDLLLPREHFVTRSPIRVVCRELAELGRWQRERLSMLERLAAADGVLEIEAAAEHAIVASGRSVSEVVRRMFARRDRSGGHHPSFNLWYDGDGNHFNVRARHGRIAVQVFLEKLSWTREEGMTIRDGFPASVLAGLVGEPLARILEHPLFRPRSIIREARDLGHSRTSIAFVEEYRTVTREEAGPEWPRPVTLDRYVRRA